MEENILFRPAGFFKVQSWETLPAGREGPTLLQVINDWFLYEARS